MVWSALQRIRREAPVVLNITNYVVMNTTANALLAIGASPVMAHAVEEVEEMAALSRAVVLNLGTPSAPWIEAMARAGATAKRLGIPVVLDPVGCGATAYRTRTARALLETLAPTVVRGNASEIRALGRAGPGPRGVDSRHTPDQVVEDALELARAARCIVAVSGAVDLIVSGTDLVRVENGSPMMTSVTGMGCTSSALCGAFLAVGPDPLEAAAATMAAVGVAGEEAAARSAGPGSFQSCFLDALYGLDGDILRRRVRMSRAATLGAR